MDLVVTRGPILKNPNPVIEADCQKEPSPAWWISIPAGRERDQERCITMNPGSALANMVTAKLVYDQALTSGVGKPLQL